MLVKWKVNSSNPFTTANIPQLCQISILPFMLLLEPVAANKSHALWQAYCYTAKLMNLNPVRGDVTKISLDALSCKEHL